MKTTVITCALCITDQMCIIVSLFVAISHTVTSPVLYTLESPGSKVLTHISTNVTGFRSSPQVYSDSIDTFFVFMRVCRCLYRSTAKKPLQQIRV